MNRKMLKRKIHRSTVTRAELVFVDENKEILPTRKEDAGQARLKKVSW